MYQLIKTNIYYSVQTKFNLAFQILGIAYISIMAFIAAPKFAAPNTDLTIAELPFTVFLFIITFLFISAPLIKMKTPQVSYSQIILSFPVKKYSLVNSHFAKLMLLMLIFLIDIFLFSWLAVAIRGLALPIHYMIIVLLNVLYCVGITGSLFILFYFISKRFDILIFILYFSLFFLLIPPLNRFWYALMPRPALVIIGTIIFMVTSYLISLISIYQKDF